MLATSVSSSRLRILLGAIVAAVMLSLMPLSAVPAGAATMAEKEDNSDFNVATAVPLGTTVKGSAFTSGSGYRTDYDYYAFTAPKAGKLALSFTFPNVAGTSQAYSVRVFNATGDELYDFDVAPAAYKGARIANSAMFLPAGRFYVEVYANTYSPAWDKEYQLTAKVTPMRAELEANDGFGLATSVPLGATVKGSTFNEADGYATDYDDYVFTAPKAGKLALSFKFPNVAGTSQAYSVRVFDATGDELYDFEVAPAAYKGARIANSAMFLPAGRFYVEVYANSYSPTWGKEYQLTAKVTPMRAELEANDGFDIATSVPLGATVKGSTFNEADGYATDYDHYVFTAPTTGKYSLRFTFPKTTGTDALYSVKVYDKFGDEVRAWDLTAVRQNGAWLASQKVSLPKGRFYVEIYANSHSPTWGKQYQLTAGRAFAAATPKITGTAKVGKTLKVKAGTWSPKPKLTYQWYRSGKAIKGATKASYKLVAKDKGKTITVKVKGTKTNYITLYKASAATKKVAGLKLTAATPKITGTAKVGKTLKAKVGTWKPKPKLTYQWYRSGKAIKGATKASYKLVAKDKGKTITVKVKGTKSGYTTVTKTSKATKKVAKK